MEKIEISKKNLSFGILYIIVKIPVPKTDFRNRKWNRFFSFLLTGTGPEPSVPVPVSGIFRNRRTLFCNICFTEVRRRTKDRCILNSIVFHNNPAVDFDFMGMSVTEWRRS